MLTEREQDTLNFITHYYVKERKAPLLAEIAQGLGIQSKGVIHRYLSSLEDQGYIERNSRSRGIELVDKPDFDELPLLGRIAAGIPFDAMADARSTQLPSYLRAGPDCYVLEVDGDSMQDEGILDGDLVVVAGDQHGRHGDIVVALIDGSEVTLKRLAYAHDMVQLIPANPNFDTLILAPDRVQIQGVVVGQMRRYQ